MLFNTLDFLVFLVAVYLTFRLASQRVRYYILLLASLFFYGYWDWNILLLLILTVYVNHHAALSMRRRSGTKVARAILIASVAMNLGFLIFFKYYNFFALNTNRLANLFGAAEILPILSIILPVGISFYTFQIISYTVDVYRGNIDPEKSFLDLLLFTTYFPQLVAGPIERAGRLLPLLKEAKPSGRADFFSGLDLALWGIFKKVFISDNLSQLVDIILAPNVHPPAYSYLFGACLFAIQVYADFSGYTDVARGVSRMFGVELVLNFDLPFFSTNPAEFWRRWHITLGAFLRDYLYIPLGGSRMGEFRKNLNILIVWTLGGLWHGATIGFLIWGFYCGALIVVYNLSQPLIQRAARSKGTSTVLRGGGRIYTFFTFAFGLLLFRADSPEHLYRMFHGIAFPAGEAISPYLLAHSLFYALPLIAVQIIQLQKGRLEIFKEFSPLFRLAISVVGSILFVLFGSFQADQFFYFQF